MVMTPEQLKRMVFPGESGGDYNALFGYANRPGKQFAGVNLTDMTVDQALQFAAPSGPYGQSVKNQIGRVATPMGAYQIVGTTLRAAKEGLGLTGNERMTPELQDQLGMWIYQNQGPGAWEAWGKGGGGGSGSRSSGGGAMPMGLFDMQEEPKTFGERLKRDWKSGELMDRIALAANSLRMDPDQNLAQAIQGRQEQRAGKETANRTAAWLMSQGREDLAQALMTGAIDPKTAVSVAMTPPSDERTALIKNYEYARSQGFQGSFENFLASGGGGGSVVNVGETVKIMPDGRLAVMDPAAEGGVRFVTPPGTQAASEVAAAEGQKTAYAATAEDSMRLIDSIISDPALPSVTGMFQGRMPPVTQAGTNLLAKIEQVQGQAFLQAFESLKGGGAITEREGLAAQNAIARLQRSQDDVAFTAALNDLKAVLDRGRRRAMAGVKAQDNDQFSGGNVINGVTVGEPIE
jgi:hypothetical protein